MLDRGNQGLVEYVEKCSDWPTYKGIDVEFRLTYRGMLPAQGSNDNRGRDKHRIRKIFHPQIRNLWKTTPPLNFSFENKSLPLLGNWNRDGYSFMPLVSDKFGLACALDILLLSREDAVAVSSHGDIDNRIKVLFDALRMPRSAQEITEDDSNNTEYDPFFVLMEDDSLITEVRVVADKLMEPETDEESRKAVLAIIKVKTKLFDRHKPFGHYL